MENGVFSMPDFSSRVARIYDLYDLELEQEKL